jgi:hypothetical protein
LIAKARLVKHVDHVVERSDVLSCERCLDGAGDVRRKMALERPVLFLMRMCATRVGFPRAPAHAANCHK